MRGPPSSPWQTNSFGVSGIAVLPSSLGFAARQSKPRHARRLPSPRGPGAARPRPWPRGLVELREPARAVADIPRGRADELPFALLLEDVRRPPCDARA